MNEAKFTPAPWELKPDYGIYTRDKDGDALLIAQVYDNAGEDVAEANAHLIDAAPDMYEMLEEIASRIQLRCHSSCEADCSTCLSNKDVIEANIKKLLKKARGEK